MLRFSSLRPLPFLHSIPNPKPQPILRLFSHLSISFPNPNPNPNFPDSESSTLCSLLTNPNLSSSADLETALDRTGIEPSSSLIQAIFDRLDSSPKPLVALFKWAEKKPDFEPSYVMITSVINALAKAREFDSAWKIVIHYGGKGSGLIKEESFTVLIRRYARSGMGESAIRTFELARKLGMDLFDVLLDALCKEGLVREASGYLDRRMGLEVPSVRVYNILLNGWFRVRRVDRVERVLLRMRKENAVPTVVTYGTLIEGYCRMGRVERAMELVGEMRSEGIEPNAVVFYPVVDALAEEGRFKDAMGMLERFSVLESGPTLSTYDSLVKGFCKFGDLVGASNILKSMINRGFMPTATTYNYFFKYFSKHGKIEEAMDLYTKMIDSGHNPDRLAFHLLIKMLCEEERLELAVQVCKEMKARGIDMDLATSTMLVHLFCKMRRLEEAFAEFEDMVRRGIAPQFLTYQRMSEELRKRGLTEMAQKLHNLMASVPHSTKLPNTYKGDETASVLRRKSIIQKAKSMSDVLKTCNNPRKLIKLQNSYEKCRSKCRSVDRGHTEKVNEI